MQIDFILNNKQLSIDVAPSELLLDLLRGRLGLMGTKENCRQGECGACSVIMDGEVVNSCLILAASIAGSEITTIEGLSSGNRLHPVQQAFMEKDGSQCGYCTPGMIMSSKALLDKVKNPSEAEIKTALAGNICRCTGYKAIIESVQEAAAKINKENSSDE